MKEVIRKEILFNLDKTIKILETKEAKDYEELQSLSNHSIEDVAVHKDFDLISVTVLVYSLYKIITTLIPDDYQEILQELKRAQESLQSKNLGKYNSNIRKIYKIIRRSSPKIKQHFSDVMHAARIKKGTTLLERGLSIGQAAGLMGLSNWDLQEYIGKRISQVKDHEAVPAKKRVINAFKIFGI